MAGCREYLPCLAFEPAARTKLRESIHSRITMFRHLAFIVPLVLCSTLHAEPKKGIEGLWYGSLKVGAIELRMGFKIETKDGKLVATLDSVDQGVRSIPAESAEFADGQLTI